MNELNDLIEGLYHETFEDGRLPQQSAPSAIVTTKPEDPDQQIARLRQVLDEMGAMLQSEDQPNMTESAPDEAACLRILNHWEQMMRSADGLRQHMQSLEQDIQKMQPWGNFDVMKVEQLASAGCAIRFWKMPAHLLPQCLAEEVWKDSQMKVIAQAPETVYYVTVENAGPEGNTGAMSSTATQPSQPHEAEEVEICPCPISTLIMLQTRDKDSLKKLETLQGDYALCHYGEVYNALRQLLPEGSILPQLHAERPGLRQRLQALFAKRKG